jgi:hypothetical protein
VGAQQLEGYGQECFLAKDDTGNEVLLGASLTGILYIVLCNRDAQLHMLGRIMILDLCMNPALENIPY